MTCSYGCMCAHICAESHKYTLLGCAQTDISCLHLHILSLSEFHSFVPALLSQPPLSKGKALCAQPVKAILENTIFEMLAG